MIRLVLNTNILVSALLQPEGPPAFVFLMGLSVRVPICVSDAVYAEYEAVLRRPRFNILPEIIDQTLASLRVLGLWVKPKATAHAASNPDDDMFLDCAEPLRQTTLSPATSGTIPRVGGTR
jgi:predicted nucleic acid-binding protein